MKKQAFMRDTLDMGALDCHSFLAGVNIGRYLSHVSPASILKALQDGAGDVDGVVKMYRIKFWRSFIDVLESLADWLTLKDLSQLDMACADKLGRPIFLGWLASKQKVFGSTYDFQYHSKKQSVFLEWILGRGVLVNRLKFKPSLVETFPTIIEVLDLQRPTLTELDFSYLSPAKADLMKVLSRGFPKLQTLLAGEVAFVPEPPDIVALSLFCPSVQTLHLKADLSTEAIAQIAMSFLRLKQLCLTTQSSGFPFDDGGLRAVADHCASLEEFQYSCPPNERKVTDAGIDYFCRRCVKVTHLNLTSCYAITDSGLLSIAKNCKAIVELNIDHCRGVSGAGVKAIAENCSKLVHLTLNSTRINDDVILALAKSCHQLECIDLDSCGDITDTAFIELIKSCKKLHEIDISGCSTLSRLSYTAIAVECVSNLTSLVINEVRELDDTILYEIVSKCSRLEHIECYDNNVTPDMIDKIRDQFPELDIYSDFDEEGDEEEDYDDMDEFDDDDEDDDDGDDDDEEDDDEEDDGGDGDFSTDTDDGGDDDDDDVDKEPPHDFFYFRHRALNKNVLNDVANRIRSNLNLFLGAADDDAARGCDSETDSGAAV